MRKPKKKKEQKNYLDLIPQRNPLHRFRTEEDGSVTLEVENTGICNRIAQKLFRRPRISYIHLDRMGSYIWPLIDGQRDVSAIAQAVDAQFGEEAKPLYPRIVKYFEILESYGFVKLDKE